MPKPQVYIHKIATVVPEKYYTQEFGLAYLLKLMGDTPPKRSFLTKIYQGSGIHKRHSVITDYDRDPSEHEFYPKNALLQPEPDTRARNELYVKEANRLSLLASQRLLEQLPGFDPQKISHLITVSCTGFSAPGFDFHLTTSLGLNPGVNRFHLGFMGCFAAFPAMKLARDICLAHPEARVLIVNVELCSLHFQQKYEPDTVVANAIFADGISAVLVSADPADAAGPKIILHDFYARYLPASQEAMAWTIGDHGFDMKLSAYVPRLLEEHIGSVLGELLRQAGRTQSDIALWAIHPGGRAILEKTAKALQLEREDLEVSYQILREYGNMSSATILFVLERILSNEKNGNIFSAAFGPGLTLETGFMEKIPGRDGK